MHIDSLITNGCCAVGVVEKERERGVEKGRWRAGKREDRKEKDHFFKQLEANLFSIFVDHLAQSMTIAWL